MAGISNRSVNDSASSCRRGRGARGCAAPIRRAWASRVSRTRVVHPDFVEFFIRVGSNVQQHAVADPDGRLGPCLLLRRFQRQLPSILRGWGCWVSLAMFVTFLLDRILSTVDRPEYSVEVVCVPARARGRPLASRQRQIPCIMQRSPRGGERRLNADRATGRRFPPRPKTSRGSKRSDARVAGTAASLFDKCPAKRVRIDSTC